MSGTTTGDDGEDQIVTANFKLTDSFLSEIDETWQGRGFNSRSEFIRYTLRDNGTLEVRVPKTESGENDADDADDADGERAEDWEPAVDEDEKQ